MTNLNGQPDLTAFFDYARSVAVEAAATIERVRHRHRPVVKSDDDGNEANCCLECDGLREDIDENAAPVLWPCPTVRDLDGDTTTETRNEEAA